ncbi:MAG TPA: hypothetical protein VG322_06370, partial [Candidatus Acidoferrales bacterium]|nr:hypothetical protein [Candidatus Acidoferrales bacterium]
WLTDGSPCLAKAELLQLSLATKRFELNGFAHSLCLGVAPKVSQNQIILRLTELVMAGSLVLRLFRAAAPSRAGLA